MKAVTWIEHRMSAGCVGRLILMSHVSGLFGSRRFCVMAIIFKRKKSTILRTTVYTIRNIYFHPSLLVIGDGSVMLFLCSSRTCAMDLSGYSYHRRRVPID